MSIGSGKQDNINWRDVKLDINRYIKPMLDGV